MAKILVLQGTPAFVASLTQECQAQSIAVLPTDDAESALARLTGDTAVDALVIHSTTENPLTLIQQAHTGAPDVAILLVCTAAQYPSLVRALQFTPGIGTDVQCVESTDPAQLVRLIQAAVQRTQTRRRYHTVLAHISQRVAAVKPPISPVSQHLGRLLEHAPIAAVLINDHGFIVGVNRQTTLLLANNTTANAMRLLGSRLDDWFHSQDRETVMQLLQPPLAERTMSPPFMIAPLGRDGKQRFVELLVAPLSNVTGETGALVFLHDVTLQQALERQKEEFLASAAHDLKTPITTLKSMVQVLQRRLRRADMFTKFAWLETMLAQMDASADRLAAQIHRLLEVTRGKMEETLAFERVPVDLVALATEAVGRFNGGQGNDRLKLETNFTKLVGLWDTARLERTLDNLLSNAIKYSPAGGDIILALQDEETPTGAVAVLMVRDNGIGIPAADLPNVFERFSRAYNVIGQIEGTGIGLADVKQAVLDLGGTVAIASQEGAGTTVTIRLPLTAGNVDTMQAAK